MAAPMDQSKRKERLRTLKYGVIQEYLDNFYKIIPLSGKKPVNNAWQKSAGVDSPEAIGNSNYGVVIDADVLVIDVDPRAFEPGDDPLQRLQEQLGVDFFAMDTLIVQTGSGGWHIYLNKPPSQALKEKHRDYRYGIEVKVKGRQVVGPYSVHPETRKTYKVYKGSPERLAPAPDNLIRMYSKGNYDMNGDNRYKGVAVEDDIARFKAILKNDTEAAVEGRGGDGHTFSTACRGRELGLSEEQTFRCMLRYWNDRCSPPWGADELKKKVNNAFQYNGDEPGKRSHAKMVTTFKDELGEVEKELIERGLPEVRWEHSADGKGGLKKTLNNTVNFLLIPSSDYYDAFQYNDFTDNMEVSKKLPWDSRDFGTRILTDADIKHIRWHLSRNSQYNTTDQDMFDACLVVSKHKCYHPVRDYLNSLKWDGIPRINSWLTDYAGAKKSAYTKEVGRKMLIGAVTRIFRPGCKFDYVTVLEGPQGVGKSMLVKLLGGEWANDITVDPTNKDIIQYMEGQWIIEMSEMVVHRRAEADALKAFLTRQIDKIRKPYHRVPVEIPRQSIFIGTINPQHGVGYLKDPTGNRRFWPIEVGEIRLDAFREDRDQIWAEAMQVFLDGEELYLSDAAEQGAKVEQSMRVTKDSYEDFVLRHIQSVVNDGQVFSAEYIMEFALQIPKSNMRDVERGRVLAILNKYYVHGCYYDSFAKRNVSGYTKDRTVKSYGGDDI